MFFKLHCWLKVFAYSPSVSVWGRFIKTRRRRAMEDLTVLGSGCWLVTPPMTFARTLQSLYFHFCMCRELRSPPGPLPSLRPAIFPAVCCFTGPKWPPTIPPRMLNVCMILSSRSHCIPSDAAWTPPLLHLT